MTLRIVLAPDSFKESLTAAQACVAIEEGMRRVWPEVDFDHVPMADGGEGTVRSLVDATGGHLLATTVDGPLGDPVEATWGILGDGRTAVIEMAEASGLALLSPERRDPRRASTRGTGQLLLAALDVGVDRIVMGIGGSATNDGGAGLAQALGIRLLDRQGRELGPGGAELARLHEVDLSGLDPRLAQVDIEVACDVTNPLCGPQGASAVYGPQKGADPTAVDELDRALAHYGRLVEKATGVTAMDRPGAGAAGGLGFALVAFAAAQLSRGVDLVLAHTRLAERVAGAALVVTGEGRMDGQTRFGKTPQGVARTAQTAGVPVVALAGSLGPGADSLHDEGFWAILPIVPGPMDLAAALAGAHENLARTAEQLARLLSPCLTGSVAPAVYSGHRTAQDGATTS